MASYYWEFYSKGRESGCGNQTERRQRESEVIRKSRDADKEDRGHWRGTSE
jgi:hypothetical protein